MRRGASSQIEPIKDIIKTVFRQIESGKTLAREDVENRWKQLVGESGFRHSRPVALRKNVLTVFVDNPGWLQEMLMKKRTLLKRLKMTFGKDRISKINFKIGEF